MYTCRKCGEEFEDRSVLGKHIHSEHKKTKMPEIEEDVSKYGDVEIKEVPVTEDNVKKVIIPIDAAEELQWIADDMPVRLYVMGVKKPEGFVVEEVRYKP
jgi:hypothetical protein